MELTNVSNFITWADCRSIHDHRSQWHRLHNATHNRCWIDRFTVTHCHGDHYSEPQNPPTTTISSVSTAVGMCKYYLVIEIIGQIGDKIEISVIESVCEYVSEHNKW